MKTKKIDLTMPVFVAINGTRGTWACANEFDRAKKNAQCRKADRVTYYKVSDIDKFPITEETLDFRKNGGLSYDVERDGYKPGDLLCPWITQYGGMVYRGECEQLVNDEWRKLNELGMPEKKAA